VVGAAAEEQEEEEEEGGGEGEDEEEEEDDELIMSESVWSPSRQSFIYHCLDLYFQCELPNRESVRILSMRARTEALFENSVSSS